MSSKLCDAVLAYIRDDNVDANVVRRSLATKQAKNAMVVFVLLYFDLLAAGVPTRNAALIAAKLGETGYGTNGSNAPILNWFSVQPANAGDTLTSQERARIAAFERLPGFVGWDSGKRAVDDKSSAAVRNPTFDTTDAMVAAQLYIVYGLPLDPWEPCSKAAVMFPRIGEVPKDNATKLTSLQLGLVLQNAGYGPRYSMSYSAWYGTVRGTVTAFLSSIRDGGASLASEIAREASTWASSALAELPQS